MEKFLRTVFLENTSGGCFYAITEKTTVIDKSTITILSNIYDEAFGKNSYQLGLKDS